MTSQRELDADYFRIVKLLPEAEAALRSYEGVRSVGVGVKETRDRIVERIVFRVYVTRKKPLETLSADERIPAEILGVPTDVVLAPVVGKVADYGKYRPLQGGINICNDSISGGGTLGCIAKRVADNSIVLLSCEHVMLDGGAQDGEPIGQPVISCCCCCKGNVVGEVIDNLNDTLVDCAIAKIVGTPGATNEIQDIGLIFGAAPKDAAGSTVTPNQRLRKRGSSTLLTVGTVLNPKGQTFKEDGSLDKNDQISIKVDPAYARFANEGDSGSVVVNDANQVVGLLYAVDIATGLKGYANIITNVTDAMGITILDSGTIGTLPLGAVPSANETAAAGVDEAPLMEITTALQRTEVGRGALALFDRHGHEINALLDTNREVKVAWHRFQGPAFTAHVIQSAREPDHRIPDEIEGVTPANLLIRMSVVLQDQGSPELAAAVEANTLPLLALVAAPGSVRELLHRVDAGDGSVVAADTTYAPV